mmetsp:Transcript_15174/g.40712  ORF Transcript_15174/g.40712 Transcript_15174/m.40712 type:complete len:249 (+) Transcript_15174:274-1020(+)
MSTMSRMRRTRRWPRSTRAGPRPRGRTRCMRCKSTHSGRALRISRPSTGRPRRRARAPLLADEVRWMPLSPLPQGQPGRVPLNRHHKQDPHSPPHCSKRGVQVRRIPQRAVLQRLLFLMSLATRSSTRRGARGTARPPPGHRPRQPLSLLKAKPNLRGVETPLPTSSQDLCPAGLACLVSCRRTPRAHPRARARKLCLDGLSESERAPLCTRPAYSKAACCAHQLGAWNDESGLRDGRMSHKRLPHNG